MEYILIKGHFHVVRYAPDGDSLMFEAQRPHYWERLQTEHREELEESLEEGEGSLQLRLQGIDALETHYSLRPLLPPRDLWGKSFEKAQKPKPGFFRQPADYGDKATEKLLRHLGVLEVKWASGFGRKWIKEISLDQGKGPQTFDEKGKDPIEGYILVNDADRRGRPISWAFPGNTSSRDGSKWSTDDLLDEIKSSLNYRLLAAGLVYPYFYMTLAAPLRQAMIYGVLNAQRQRMGLWSEDKTQEGIRLNAFSQLVEKDLIFPYLFRRMAKHQLKRQYEAYWEAVSNKQSYTPDTEEMHLDTFFDDTNPYVLLVEERDFQRLDNIMEISGNSFRLKTHPGNIVFLS